MVSSDQKQAGRRPPHLLAPQEPPDETFPLSLGHQSRGSALGAGYRRRRRRGLGQTVNALGPDWSIELVYASVPITEAMSKPLHLGDHHRHLGRVHFGPHFL